MQKILEENRQLREDQQQLHAELRQLREESRQSRDGLQQLREEVDRQQQEQLWIPLEASDSDQDAQCRQ